MPNIKYDSYVGAVSFQEFSTLGKFAHNLGWFTGKTVKNKYGDKTDSGDEGKSEDHYRHLNNP